MKIYQNDRYEKNEVVVNFIHKIKFDKNCDNMANWEAINNIYKELGRTIDIYKLPKFCADCGVKHEFINVFGKPENSMDGFEKK